MGLLCLMPAWFSGVANPLHARGLQALESPRVEDAVLQETRHERLPPRQPPGHDLA
jgi:hypothetical protein